MVDASLRMSIVNLFTTLRDELGVSIIYITHDLATAYYISDRIIIMRKGKVVESGDARAVLDNPQHPYSQLLKSSVLSPERPARRSTEECPPMRNVDGPPPSRFRRSATTDPRLFGAFVEHLGRCVYGGIFEPGHPTADAKGFRQRRAGAGARAGADDHALSRRQLRLRLQLGGRRRPGRPSGRAGSTSPGCRPRPTPSAPTSSSTGAGWPTSSRCWRSTSARAAATRRATWSNTATIPAARRCPTCAARTAGSKPHDVKFWCLGNEMDGPWQMGAKTADGIRPHRRTRRRR